jgi:hypothetical protein
MVMLGETRQTALERYRNVGDSKIENDQAEAARAQELLSRSGNTRPMNTDNGQGSKINSAESYIGRIKTTFHGCHPGHRLLPLLRFPDQAKGESQ